LLYIELLHNGPDGLKHVANIIKTVR